MAQNSSLAFARLDDDIIHFQRLGFDDAARRRPFTAAYERMTNIQQRNYEIGRMMAALARPGHQGQAPQSRRGCPPNAAAPCCAAISARSMVARPSSSSTPSSPATPRHEAVADSPAAGWLYRGTAAAAPAAAAAPCRRGAGHGARTDDRAGGRGHPAAHPRHAPCAASAAQRERSLMTIRMPARPGRPRPGRPEAFRCPPWPSRRGSSDDRHR